VNLQIRLQSVKEAQDHATACRVHKMQRMRQSCPAPAVKLLSARSTRPQHAEKLHPTRRVAALQLSLTLHAV
jgi:hypothetical protein